MAKCYPLLSAQISFLWSHNRGTQKRLTALTVRSLYTDYTKRKKKKIALYNGLLNFASWFTALHRLYVLSEVTTKSILIGHI